MLRHIAEEEAEARADEERGRENAADRAGTEGGRGGEHFQNENDGERLPDPVAVRGWRSRRCSRSRKLRDAGWRAADDQAADAHFQVNRRDDPRRETFACAQQTNEPGRDQAGEKAEQQVRNDFPVSIQLKWRDVVERVAAKKSAHRQGGDDGGKNERPENFHRDRAEHDLGDEERAGDRCVVGGGDTGGRAATDEQSQSRGATIFAIARQSKQPAMKVERADLRGRSSRRKRS